MIRHWHSLADTLDPFGDEAPLTDFSETNRYWSDPIYRRRCDMETEHARALANQRIDHGMRHLNAAQEARWAQEAQA
jgi:hypothetical protein